MDSFSLCRGDARLGERAAGGAAGVRRGGGRRREPRRKLGQGDRGDAEGRQLGDAGSRSCWLEVQLERPHSSVALCTCFNSTLSAARVTLTLFRSSLLHLSQRNDAVLQFRFTVWCCRSMSDQSLREILQLPPGSYSASVQASAAVGLGGNWDATISA